mgnify:CR=1 FL=1
MDKGVLVTETHHGWMCANAGVDQSNVDADSVRAPARGLRPLRARLRDRVRALTGADVFVIITDTFGRPWREGLTNVAIGVAGFAPLLSYLGERDPAGRPLQATILALADEAGRRRRARHGQARPRPGGDRARAHPEAERGGLEAAPARPGARPLPVERGPS